MNKQSLTDSDLKLLSASFISPELAQSAGIFRVDTHEGGAIVGRNGGADYAGLVFPYFLPCDSQAREYRLRRDNPDLEQKPDGTIKEKAKYLSPFGRSNMLYFVPMTASDWLSKTSLPVCITEGEKKTLALWELAWQGLSETALTPRFLPIGVSGVWNWRGTIGKTENAKGQRQDVKGVIPDFDLIEWRKRVVYIVFDANVKTNEGVQAARRELCKELTRRGAIVRFVDLPDMVGVNGVDDLLALKGADYVCGLFDAAKSPESETTKKKSQSSVLVELIEDAQLFHTSEGDTYATIPIKHHLETWALKSRGFRDWLSKRFYESEGSIPNAQALQDALNTLQGIARHDGQEIETHIRLAEKDGCIWLDLCDEEWRAVKISKEGWEIVSNPPVKFRRTKGMKALPLPIKGGSVWSLRQLVNVTDADWPLLISWLVTAFRPGYPFPVLVLHGEQGSAKSTRVDTHEGGAIVGRNGGADYAGLVFPYFLPCDSQAREYRLRRDNPDLEQKPDGTIKEKAKYLSPFGRSNMLYFVPMTASDWLSKTSLPVCITEGEKKTLALWELAWQGLSETALTPRFLPIGVSGVWNWRGTIGKTENAKGQRQDVKGVIPDFDLIEWRKRVVYIVFDANVKTNEGVQAARRELCKELTRRGAIVRFVDLPDMVGVNGVDDLLALKGADYVCGLFDAAKSPESETTKKKSQSSVLVELIEDAQLFHTSEGDTYATIPIKHHLETWALKSRGFRDWLSKRFYESEGSIPNAQALQDALNTLQGIARHDGQEIETHIRLAEKDGCIWLDLCDEEWRAVKISKEGWEIVSNPPVKFRRTKGMKALPLPIKGGSVWSLRQLVNVTDADWPLLISWLVTAFRPGYPFPVLVLHGEQGSAKSTVSKMLRNLIDPNIAPLRSEQRDERDLMLAATNGWVVGLDNLSKLPVWLSDALCRLSTGSGFATRTLYENDEETLFMAMRPILLNGIEELTTRSDLLDRSVIIHLPAIAPDKRKTEAEVWQEFERIRPFVLGGLLDGVSHALRNIDSVQLEQKPRMADFALWATAAEESLGLEREAFISAFMGNREGANELALEASLIASILIEFVQEQGSWKGKSSELLKELNQRASDEVKKQQGWPKRANSLSGAIKRIAPNLRAVGIDSKLARTKVGSSITLESVSKTSSPSSPSSPSTESTFDIESTGDDARADDDDLGF